MKNYIKSLGANWPVIIITLLVLVFFYPFIVFGKIPIPADTIVGMYHPWRDVIWDGLSSGVPFKNFLITDPVRQHYVWRKIAIEELKKGKLPLWNPYSFSGTPLLANFQTAAFYPLNILFFILPFDFAWGVLIVLQPLLAGLFLYSYLRYINVGKMGSFFGAWVFAFSGFTIAWLEWNTIIQTILWLPLVLLAKEKLLKKVTLKWSIILFGAEVCAFLAGHLQVLFYTLIISNLYLFIKIIQFSVKNKRAGSLIGVAYKKYLPFLIIGLLVFIVSSIQFIPTLQFISNSARQFDQGSYTKAGWFLPWQNLIQFIAPDFFGNPATGNYWGIWNYGEFIGYIGLMPLIFALYGIIFAMGKKTLFWGLVGFLALIFVLPTPLAKLPYILNLPFISTSQPTRLMVVVDFSLSILAALGFDWFLRNLKDRNNQKKLVGITLLVLLIFLIIWLFVINPSWMQSVLPDNLLVAKRNLIFPTITTVLIAIFFFSLFFLRGDKRRTIFMYIIVVTVTTVDLFRFGWKFTPFTKEEWIFPSTKLIKIISDENDHSRFMALDRRIMPPNFSVAYKINDVSGYDPLYIKQYGQLVSSWEKNAPDLSNASFNRIITPQNYDSFITDLLGVKYLLSLQPLNSPKLQLVGLQGETYLYENKHAFPKAFFVENVVKVAEDNELLNKMFSLGDKLKTTAVLTDDLSLEPEPLKENETVKIVNYSPNQVDILVDTEFKRLLVLTDIYYPAWKVYLDGVEVKLYKANFIFRGVVVPVGSHRIEFKSGII